MGRGVGQVDKQTQQARRGPMLANSSTLFAADEPAVASASETPTTVAPAWDEPGGPEATRSEVESWVQQIFPRATEQYRADVQAKALQELDDGEFDQRAWLPSRRGLEAALAAWHGISPEEYKLRNAQRSWGELASETIDAQDKLRALAVDGENAYRSAMQTTGKPPLPFQIPERARRPVDPSRLESLIAKAGAGARSGQVQDYTRAELRKLLGFLERDCKHLSDDDLRGMALDGHLVPHYKDAPSHVELATRYANRYSWSFRSKPQESQFRQALRIPYGQLAGKHSYQVDYDDGEKRSLHEIRNDIARHHPFLLRADSSQEHGDEKYRLLGNDFGAQALLHKLAVNNDISLLRPESSRNRAAAGAANELKTPLELSYADAFDGFVQKFGGGGKLGKIRTGLTKTNGQRISKCAAFYSRESGDIHINTRYVKQVLGKNPEPAQVERTVATIAHELFHSLEGRDEGSRATGMRNSHTPEHALDEGATEALARLHVEDLAVRMDLWNADSGTLRGHTSANAYDKEVETTTALAAACCGELDKEKLLNGEYAQPEILSANARQWLQELHLQHGPEMRIQRITARFQSLAEEGKAANSDVRAKESLADEESSPSTPNYRDVRRFLSECKSNRHQWRTKREPKLDESGKYLYDPKGRMLLETTYQPPESLGEGLARILQELGL